MTFTARRAWPRPDTDAEEDELQRGKREGGGDGELEGLADQHPMLTVRSGSDGNAKNWEKGGQDQTGLVAA